ncbi:hypothetical protein [Gaetbulibacter aestuarii]|uniref:Lipocalin-like domain-containing protein n=1 Tax=Gaetbulibacter aestuarii TaxID=1502358 RepID=A0ABW7MVD9_9FLAO
MKYWLPALCLLLLCSCDKPKDPEVDCSLYDPFFSNLLIELVDDQGENLIENNTYPADEITINYKGNISTNVVFNDVPGLENLISMNLFGDAGENTFILNLSDTVSDTLVLNLSIDIPVCNIPLYTLNTATYNGEVQSIITENGTYRITVVK